MDMRVSIVCGLALAVGSGCAGNQVEPVMVSSAGASTYAVSYPHRVQQDVTALQESMQQLGELPGSLTSRRTELDGADPAVVKTIVEEADGAGRSDAYAASMRDHRGLWAFWEEARKPVAARVNAAAKKRLTESGCNQEVDFDGPVHHALKTGVEKEAIEQARAHNEAHRVIEMNEPALGKGNRKAAEELADDIARSSYVVNIALVEVRDRLRHLLDERSDVEDTLDAAIERERAYQQAEHTPAERKASEERMADFGKSRALIPEATRAAESALQDIDPKIERAREQHQSAIEALLEPPPAAPAANPG